jgi:hypothetical protein
LDACDRPLFGLIALQIRNDFKISRSFNPKCWHCTFFCDIHQEMESKVGLEPVKQTPIQNEQLLQLVLSRALFSVHETNLSATVYGN